MIKKLKFQSNILLFLPYLIFVSLFVLTPIIFIIVLSFITPAGAAPDYDK